jgi:hypothetical protein
MVFEYAPLDLIIQHLQNSRNVVTVDVGEADKVQLAAGNAIQVVTHVVGIVAAKSAIHQDVVIVLTAE